jgi:hypothetical protein
LVPCEHLFSARKQTAVNRHAHLGTEKFEQLQVLKFAWRANIPDLSVCDEEVVNNVYPTEYDALHYQDMTDAKLNDELGISGTDDNFMVLLADY